MPFSMYALKAILILVTRPRRRLGQPDGGEFCEPAGSAQAGETRLISGRNMLVGTGKTMRCLAKYLSRLCTSRVSMRDM